ncbi:MAG: hypothetical protein KY447_09280 [Actinobacteria bacterium]|nr:hypothetical protein [Actinomycetota bacterium]
MTTCILALRATLSITTPRRRSPTEWPSIADRKVADEYFAVTEQVEALYTAEAPVLPAAAEGDQMRRLRLEMQRRLLGNGYCTRPVELDCAFETCVHFDTGTEFRARPVGST